MDYLKLKRKRGEKRVGGSSWSWKPEAQETGAPSCVDFREIDTPGSDDRRTGPGKVHFTCNIRIECGFVWKIDNFYRQCWSKIRHCFFHAQKSFVSKASGIFADRRYAWKTSKESRIFPCSSRPVRSGSVRSVGSRSKGIGEAGPGASAVTAAAGHSTRGWNGKGEENVKTATLKTIPVTELKPAAYNLLNSEL